MKSIANEIHEWEINTSEYDGFGMDLIDPKEVTMNKESKSRMIN